MRQHFRSWEPIAASAIPAFAILLVIAWTRSQFTADIFRITTSRHGSCGIFSDRGLIGWNEYYNPNFDFPFPGLPAWINQEQFFIRDLMDDPTPASWTIRYKGFGVGKTINPDESSFMIYAVPYWFVTLPMVLSAYLLLTKPRPPNQKATVSVDPSFPDLP